MRSRRAFRWAAAFAVGAVVAVAVFIAFTDGSASPWRLVAGLAVGAVVGAAVFGLVNDRGRRGDRHERGRDR